MAEIYLTYGMKGEGAIDIHASYGWRPENIRFLFKSEDIIHSTKTPNEVLNELEDLIKLQTGEGAPFSNIFRDRCSDNNSKYKDQPRTLIWLPLEPDSTEPEEVRRAEECNSTLGRKIFPIYREFVEKRSLCGVRE